MVAVANSRRSTMIVITILAGLALSNCLFAMLASQKPSMVETVKEKERLIMQRMLTQQPQPQETSHETEKNEAVQIQKGGVNNLNSERNLQAKEDYLKTFLQLAQESLTDKVGSEKLPGHQYHFAYEKFLADLRHSPVRFLEIGLGCHMSTGPGRSLRLWDRYFTHKDAQIFFIEYVAKCAERWKDPFPRVSVDAGDQTDVGFLHSYVEKYGGNFDVIIDDGGHSMVQQLTSIIHLFPSLRSGGIYFLEDLHTSYNPGFGGGYLNEKSSIEYIKKMIDGFYGQGPATEIIDQIRSITCYHEICVFEKK